MASDVDLCNLALAHLGDEAIVSSINPPDGSAQSSHCARFYPIARDALIEMYAWGFATTRVALAQVTNPSSTWLYAYAAPADCVNYLEVLDPNSTDEYSTGVPVSNTSYGSRSGVGVYTPQPYEIETDGGGNAIVYTNLAGAVLRYTRSVSDTTQFTPLFNAALPRFLASMLAGPILKGAEGRQESLAQLKIFETLFEAATESDANQRRLNVVPGAPWMAGR